MSDRSSIYCSSKITQSVYDLDPKELRPGRTLRVSHDRCLDGERRYDEPVGVPDPLRYPDDVPEARLAVCYLLEEINVMPWRGDRPIVRRIALRDVVEGRVVGVPREH